MHSISIDIETVSSVNLKTSGVYRYAESDDFEILLLGYSIDGSDIKVIDLAREEPIPDDFIDALTNEQIEKWAFNAQFERICLSRYLWDKGLLSSGAYLSPTAWKCTMIWAATLGLPLSLEGVGAVVGLEKQKLAEGKKLIKYFCVPCLPTKSNSGRKRNMPCHDLAKWEQFKTYNYRDVETEMGIQMKLSRFPVSENVWTEYHLDQEINDRGISVDMTFVKKAIELDKMSKAKISQQLQERTNIENPNSVQQMRAWLRENGLNTDSLGKKVVAELMQNASSQVKEILLLRQQLAKSSIKKYTAMENAVCRDNRLRGMFQFYGANRTGRFAGRLVQLQNRPQNHISDLADARNLIKMGQIDAVDVLYDDIPGTLSELIRTSFVPRENSKFIVADFSSIEARVLAWLAGERWRMKVFEEGKDIYCSSASQMFGVPVEKNGINGHLRQKEKLQN